MNGQYLSIMKDDPSEGVTLRCEDKGSTESQLWTVKSIAEDKENGVCQIQSIFGKVLEADL